MAIRITQFDRLVAISPYPVRKRSTIMMYSGVFWWGEIGDTKPYQSKDFTPMIDIDITQKPNARLISTLIHEIGHAIHYKRHCRCYIEHDNFLAEYHAERFALRFMLRYKLKAALRYEINDMMCHINKYSVQWQHIIERLQQDKIWRKCIDYLK